MAINPFMHATSYTGGFPGGYPPVAVPMPPAGMNVHAPAFPAYHQQAIATLPNAGQMPAEIKHALILLGQIRHLPHDEAHMRRLGVDIIFRNGQEALNTIIQKGLRVDFGDMGDSKAHAQWIQDENLIMINQKYRGSLTKETLYAISEAIYHEAGHAARMGDNQASIQEEINCLALNTLANRFHAATDPAYASNTSNSRLITDGVALYSRLFFDPDPAKQGLINRVIEKYGQLPPETPDHKIPVNGYGVSVADRVLRQIQHNNTVQWFG